MLPHFEKSNREWTRMDAKFSEQVEGQPESTAQERANLMSFAFIRVHSRSFAFIRVHSR